jgi:hypothetical protein
MAVIKIVPMPGAVGDKGDEGAVGPRGQQGETGLQGPSGADALWSYNGEYNPGAGYAVGDVVTFDGQLWYRKNSNGGNVGDTPSEGLFWDLLAAKGADSIAPTSGSWNSRFYEENGIVPNLSGSVAPGYSNDRSQLDYPIKSNYYTIGDMVFWHLNALVIDATQWSELTSNTIPGGVDYYRQWRFYLPFNHDPNFYDWIIDGLQSGGTPVPFVGRASIRNDFDPDIADDEYFVMPIYGALVTDAQTGESYVALSYVKDSEIENSAIDNFHGVNAQDPTDLTLSPEPGSSLFRSVRVTMSGSYKKA